MTSAELDSELGGVKKVGDATIIVSPSEVYNAATFAQNDILRRLKPIEETAQLALIQGQERYSFLPQSPASVLESSSGTARLTFPTAHPYHEGDTIVVASSLSVINGRRILTAVSTLYVEFSFTGTLADTTLTGAKTYHALQAAMKLLDDGFRKVSNASGSLFGTIIRKGRTDFELYREEFGTSSTPEEVINFMEEYTEPCITLCVQGIPGANLLTSISYKRRALPCEKISVTVDPIMPDYYDELFLLGTKWQIFSNRDESVCEAPAAKWGALYETRMAQVIGQKTRDRVIYGNEGKGLTFG
jgi:hypothetical protein